LTIDVDEGRSVEAIVARPSDRKRGLGFLDGDRFGIAVTGKPCGEMIAGVEKPGVAGLGREQGQLVGGDDAPVPDDSSSPDGANLVDGAELATARHGFSIRADQPPGETMDVFVKLFGEFLVFVYHCFDRIVIHGYLTALSRPELVVHFFRNIVGVPEVSKEVLSQRTNDYQRWVEAYARNHSIPIEWAEKGVRKEDHVLPWLRRMGRRNACGVYFIFKSMEQGPTYRVSLPKYPSKDPHYRILAHQRSRFTHYYFYIRDAVLGPMVVLVGSFFPFQTAYYLNGHSFIEQELKRAGIGFRKHDNAFLGVADPMALQTAADSLSADIIRRRLDYWTLIVGPKFSKNERTKLNLSRLYAISQIEYCRNFIFKRHFPIHKLFERSCELGLGRLGADKIAVIFGTRLNRRMRGKLATIIDQIEHGHHVFRAYFKHAFLKQYEKFSTFLRNELVSNNLNDFGLRKGLDQLDAVRPTFQAITDRFAGFQAEWLNVHVDFPLLQRLAHPITVGAVRYPGIKIHEVRVVRLFEVLLHGGPQAGGWTARQIHHAVLTSFDLSDNASGLNQLRYDLRKLKGHALIERDGSRYAYRLSPKGIQVALLILFFHKRLCGPLANSRFHHRPDPKHQPRSRLELAYHRADAAIQPVVDLLAAA
jgi:hypothetical protein